MTGFRIEKLTRSHAVEDFDCGEPALTRFLTRFALPSQQSNAATTYVGLTDDVVIGFYSLVVSEVDHEGAPERLSKGMAQHPVPLMLLARLALQQAWQGRGIGAGLLKDAMRRTVQAADIAGIRALAVHAKDKGARDFYRHFDFIDSPSDPMHLFLLIKELRRAAGMTA